MLCSALATSCVNPFGNGNSELSSAASDDEYAWYPSSSGTPLLTGTGFDRLSGEAIGYCFDRAKYLQMEAAPAELNPEEGDPVPSGHYEVVHVTNHEEIQEIFNFTNTSEANYMMFGGNDKFSYLSDIKFTEDTEHIAAIWTYKHRLYKTSGEAPAFNDKCSSEVVKMKNDQNYIWDKMAFRRDCGDGYVNRITVGVKAIFIFTFHSTKSESHHKAEFLMKAKAGVKDVWGASHQVELSAETKKMFEKHNTTFLCDQFSGRAGVCAGINEKNFGDRFYNWATKLTAGDYLRISSEIKPYSVPDGLTQNFTSDELYYDISQYELNKAQWEDAINQILEMRDTAYNDYFEACFANRGNIELCEAMRDQASTGLEGEFDRLYSPLEQKRSKCIDPGFWVDCRAPNDTDNEIDHFGDYIRDHLTYLDIPIIHWAKAEFTVCVNGNARLSFIWESKGAGSFYILQRKQGSNYITFYQGNDSAINTTTGKFGVGAFRVIARKDGRYGYWMTFSTRIPKCSTTNPPFEP